MVFEPVFRCRDKESKTNRVILDGGSEGNYTVELCPKCNTKQNWKFLIKKEIIIPSHVTKNPTAIHGNDI